MLFDVCCSVLFAVCGLMFVVRCVLSVVCNCVSLLDDATRCVLMFVVGWWLLYVDCRC